MCVCVCVCVCVSVYVRARMRVCVCSTVPNCIELLCSINIPMIRRKILDDLRGSLRIWRHLKTPPVPHYCPGGELKETIVVVGF